MIDAGLIPVAIARAQLVQPHESIKEDWENAIFKDLNNHSPSFSWNRFLYSLVP